MGGERSWGGSGGGSILGSLRDALAAAGRDEGGAKAIGHSSPKKMPPDSELKDVTNAIAQPSAERHAGQPPAIPGAPARAQIGDHGQKSAVDAARDARGGTPNIPELEPPELEPVVDLTPPTTGIVRKPASSPASSNDKGAAKVAAAASSSNDGATRFVRGKQKVSRNDFAQDPVVGWLVVVGGPGLGAFRPVYEGNNTVGRAPSNRVAIDFGDESISNEEQAYIRYDSADRSFLLVPNLSKTNVISHNEQRPSQPVALNAMDLITMGRTQLVFVPFCGADFDWGELSELNR